MNALTAAIYAKLSGDATLAGYLASYTPPGSTAVPAIIASDPLPFDVPIPYVIIDEPMHDVWFGGKIESLTGREVTTDIRCFDEASGSLVRIGNITERVRTLLHNVPLTVGGFTNFLALCAGGPIRVPSDPRVVGRALTFRFYLN